MLTKHSHKSIVGMKMMRPVKLEGRYEDQSQEAFFARLSYGDMPLHTRHAHTEASPQM
jgi:hypothetical protein